jgi:hypothetical protein
VSIRTPQLRKSASAPARSAFTQLVLRLGAHQLASSSELVSRKSQRGFRQNPSESGAAAADGHNAWFLGAGGVSARVCVASHAAVCVRGGTAAEGFIDGAGNGIMAITRHPVHASRVGRRSWIDGHQAEG